MKTKTNTKAKAGNSKAKKPILKKGMIKSSAVFSPRLASNHSETMLIR
jgi:hypothetical protein